MLRGCGFYYAPFLKEKTIMPQLEKETRITPMEFVTSKSPFITYRRKWSKDRDHWINMFMRKSS